MKKENTHKVKWNSETRKMQRIKHTEHPINIIENILPMKFIEYTTKYQIRKNFYKLKI